MSELGELLARHFNQSLDTEVKVVFDSGIHHIPLHFVIEMSLLEPGKSLDCLDCRTGDLLTITCVKEESTDEEEDYIVTTTLSN